MSKTKHRESVESTDVIAREQEIHAKLAEIKTIATFWTTRDVQFYRPDLNEEQAWQVLELCKQQDCGGYRMSWRAINRAADKLFASKVKARIKRCDGVIKTYCERREGDEFDVNVVNLLADAMHWCRKNRYDFRELIRQAEDYFYKE